jgi:hypothetical protein
LPGVSTTRGNNRDVCCAPDRPTVRVIFRSVGENHQPGCYYLFIKGLQIQILFFPVRVRIGGTRFAKWGNGGQQTV